MQEISLPTSGNDNGSNNNQLNDQVKSDPPKISAGGDSGGKKISQKPKKDYQKNKRDYPDPFPNTSPPPRDNKRPDMDDWSDPWSGEPLMGDPQTNMPGGRKMSPKERVKMIEEVYQTVLGRKPDSRDINYYKYSTLTAEEIQQQLLEGKEHEKLIKEGREYKKAIDRAQKAEMRSKELEGQIKDQVDEYKHLSELLKEKNALIQQLRSEISDPYNFSGVNAQTRPQPPSELQQTQQPVQAQQSQNYTQPQQVDENSVEYDRNYSPKPYPQPNQTDYQDEGLAGGSMNQVDSTQQSQPEAQSEAQQPNNGRKIVPPNNYEQQETDTQSTTVVQEDPISRPKDELDQKAQQPNGDEENSKMEKSKSDSESQLPPGDESTIDKDEVVGFFDGTLDEAFKILDRKGKREPRAQQQEMPLDQQEKQPEQKAAAPTTVPQAAQGEVINSEAYSSLDNVESVSQGSDTYQSQPSEIVNNYQNIPSQMPQDNQQPASQPQQPQQQTYQQPNQSIPNQQPQMAPNNQYQQNQPENMVFSSPTFNGETPEVQEPKKDGKNKGLAFMDKIVDRFSP